MDAADLPRARESIRRGVHLELIMLNLFLIHSTAGWVRGWPNPATSSCYLIPSFIIGVYFSSHLALAFMGVTVLYGTLRIPYCSMHRIR